MRSGFLLFLIILASYRSPLSWGQANGGDFSTNMNPSEVQKVPEGVIIVKGAWASASDNANPLPEGGSVTNNIFSDPYFGLSYGLPQNWIQKHAGPPPSDTGRYILALITPTKTYQGTAQGSVLITAQDMFFTPLPVANALDLVNFTKDNLQADYKVEMKPTQTKIAGHSFTFFAYWSPAAELHWYILATQIRCHAVEIVLNSRDTKLLESLVVDLNKMKLPADSGPTAGKGGGAFPTCIKDYASEENVIERVEPVFNQRTFNPVPVRIIIDKEGKVKHIHFLSAFPEQAKAITDALGKWKFRSHIENGQPVEVETGIMFGRAPTPIAFPAKATSTD